MAVQIEEWPAPVAGWWQSGNRAMAPRDQAEVLDNWFPLSQGVRLRRGSVEYADLGASVRALFSYSATGDDLFGATETAIFDADRVAVGSNDYAEIEGLTSGDWSVTQISTSGGEYLVGVNGADNAWRYDGADFNPVVDEEVFDLAFDTETASFAVGETVTGGTSGASAEIHAITKDGATSGTLKIGAITGTFNDDETISGSGGGSATSNIPSGTSSATSIAISGVTTNSLSQVWTFKGRLFFIEKDSLKFWYLPVGNLGGTATSFDLGGIFQRGGKLLFGATWSVDSGDGLNDMCIFVTTNGEVAIYNGTDPSNANTWSIVGVYTIGRPVNKHGYFKSGGDLMILTKDGIIPLSQAISKDRSGLQSKAMTYPIEEAWRKAVADESSNYPISACLWHKQTFLLIGIPTTVNGTNVSYVANSRTGAWCRYTGWDVRCSAVSGDDLYFGSDNGKVYLAESGGEDAGAAYSGICVPKFSSRDPNNKFLTRANIITRAPTKPTMKVKGLTNYKVPEIPAPETTPTVPSATWGSGVWGTFVWGGSAEQNTYQVWKKVSGRGFAVSLGVLVTSNDTSPADVEIISMKVAYEAGAFL
jgi:hypothetical protein